MKNIKLLFALLFTGYISFAQAPQKFNYQAVIRNGSNALVANTAIGMRVSILQGSSSGTAVYVETHVPTTNLNGLATVSIGSGSVVSGSMATIDWSAGPYFIKTETDPAGGTNYTITGTTQMVSSPYALYAAKSGSSVAAGSDTQISYNNAGVASGSANNTWNDVTSTHTVTGTSVTTNETITALAGSGTRVVGVDATGNLISLANGIIGSGSNTYLTKWTGTSTQGNSQIQDNGTSLSINYPPQALSKFFVYQQQQTATGDGQHTLMGYRDRNTQNIGSAYSQVGTNSGSAGLSFWGDQYSFATAGFNYNDFNRCGGTLGAEYSGAYWGSLGYKNSANTFYGVYGSNAYSNGTGRSANAMAQGVGGGFFGVIGTMSKGNVVGQINSGSVFSSYNSGNVYTLGKNVELVGGLNDTKTPVYAVTSTESTIYSKGKIQLVNGEAYVSFDKSYASLLGEEPEVTVTARGNCNGVYIASMDKNGFIIKEINNGSSNVVVSWISVGNRIDNKIDEATKMVSSSDFDKNIQDVLFNDGSDLTGKGKAIWWDGSKIQFGTMPESLSKTVRSKDDSRK
ncbi:MULTISPECIES: hypothetical protein [Flavobacterium]|uniref:Peptidase S74 domain-containing protein n=1 Tax=Flavobacterium hankyongi TaxID=1176532 RepID=A0ABP8ZQ73_9FLAO|nr:hypothetical protein [Flavobacterium sp. N1846]